DPVEIAEARYGREDRIRARRYHHVVGRVPRAVDFHHTPPREPSRPAQHSDAAVLQPALLPGVGVVGYHEVAPGERGLDVDVRARRSRSRPWIALVRCPGRYADAASRVGVDSASWRPLRELIPSLVNTFRRCHSTVRALM